jgi:RNA-directed DNA polymerase
MSHGLDRVRQAAWDRKQERFTALLHYLDVDRLRSADDRLRKEATEGVDGVSWAAYGNALEGRLADQHARDPRTGPALPERRR